MKKMSLIVGMLLALALVPGLQQYAHAQGDKVRPSLKASTMQMLGVDAEITIVYSRPGVKGRKIWGELVPYGMAPGNKYSKEKPYPWRAGANENTTFACTKDLLVEGKKLDAGEYSIHMIPGEKDWVVIFNNNTEAWGSYSYDQAEDALRVTVMPVKAPMQEWLTYGFEDLAGTSATAYLQWEMLKVPLKIKLAE